MQVAPENQNKLSSGSNYYHQMKLLARQKRVEYQIGTQKISLSLVRKLYKREGVTIDYWDLRSPRIKASYHCDDIDCSVLVKRNLPDEPKLFALIHELKHHFVDKESIQSGEFVCGDYNENEIIEKGAEVFAAEFIFPELDMRKSLNDFGMSNSNCTSVQIVEYKRSCGVSVSYTFILKRLAYFGIIGKDYFRKIQFQKLEEEMYPPIYKQPGFIPRRKQYK